MKIIFSEFTVKIINQNNKEFPPTLSRTQKKSLYKSG